MDPCRQTGGDLPPPDHQPENGLFRADAFPSPIWLPGGKKAPGAEKFIRNPLRDCTSSESTSPEGFS